MKDELYVIWTRQGIDRTTKRAPDSRLGEFPVRLVLTLPDDIFAKQPVPVVEIELASRQVGAATVTVDGTDQSPSAGEAAAQQSVALSVLADLLQTARDGQDGNLFVAYEEAMERLIKAGVAVRLVEAEAEQ